MRSVLALFLAIGAAVGGAACKTTESPIGRACTTRDDCVGRADCVELGSGKSVCTKSCMMPRVMGPPGTPPTPDECPPPTTCQLVSMEVQVPDKTVDIPKIARCLPPGM